MFCKSCGKEVADGSSFCTSCGARLDQTSQGQNASQNYTTRQPMQEYSSLQEGQGNQKGFFKGKEKKIGTSGEIKFNSNYEKPKKKRGIIKKLFLFIILVVVGFVAYTMFFGGNIASLEMASDIDPNTFAPTAISESFTTDTPAIYATFFITGLDIGTPVQGEWVYENQQIAVAELYTTEKNQNAYFYFTIPDTGWATGAYAINIYVNGEYETTKEFSIR
jgi:hypothetical protein